MRIAFVDALTQLAEKDKNIYVLIADVGFSLFDNFREKFPDRFINCGVAEQSMMGIAAGLALSGKKVYVYSIIPFVTFRCLEQIRNDICYQNLDVKIIGVGSGFTYGSLGLTHHALEDVAVLRALPNMSVLCPADPIETRELIFKSYQTKSPTYIRLPGSGEKPLYDSSPDIKIGKPSVLREGKDGLIVATGICVEIGIEVIEKLKEAGLNFKLISFHTLKPIDVEALFLEIGDNKLIFTIEEHNIIGGLGTILAEVLAESNWQGKFKRIAIPDEYCSEIGSAEYLRKSFGLTAEDITKRILEDCKKII